MLLYPNKLQLNFNLLAQTLDVLFGDISMIGSLTADYWLVTFCLFYILSPLLISLCIPVSTNNTPNTKNSQ